MEAFVETRSFLKVLQADRAAISLRGWWLLRGLSGAVVCPATFCPAGHHLAHRSALIHFQSIAPLSRNYFTYTCALRKRNALR
jgi:hypothetical protein